MLEFHQEADGGILTVKMTGKLTKEDYQAFVPEVERLIREHGTIRVLCQMHDFHGWTVGALWEDIKFDARHFSDIEQLALVGERKWQAAMAIFCKPFTKATVRYFDQSELHNAEEWIRGELYAGAKTASSVGHDSVQEASEGSFPASDPPAR
jgi:SpoIIAA-like